MTTARIRQLLADGEGFTIEYKECVNKLNNSVWETVCSFSNRYGGHLILGAENDGTPKHVRNMFYIDLELSIDFALGFM